MSELCANCGAPFDPGDRFCSSCGAPLALAQGAERKLATILFCDIVDSTVLAAGADPEQLRGRLAPFFQIARDAVAEHGGTVEKFIGDAVMAVFGVPRAHGDDPDRALAAGLALVDRLGAEGLEVRVGVETGEVLALESGGDLSVTGEAVNAAARMQGAAGPGEVLAGARTARAARCATFDEPVPIQAKGFPKPLAARRLAGIADQSTPPDTPFLGRDDDLELLRLIYRRAVQGRAPELVTIAGEAGIGKTRLATELFEDLRDADPAPQVLVGRNPPYGRGIALWALGEILRSVAGAGMDDSAADVREALRRRLEGLGAPDAAELAAGLAVALGGTEADGGAEDELKRAWRRLVGLLAAERPLVIGIDDAHFADDGLLDLVEEAAFGLEDAPVLILCTARPELLERRPGFGRAARSVTQLELRPLQPEATVELASALLENGSSDMAGAVAQASGGNPFFAEEVARRITDDPGTGLGGDLPENVQAAIAARLDLLPPDEKRSIQQASVLGAVFRAQALADLLGSDDTKLDELTRKALVRERVAEGGGRYAFRHQLIRDVAYSSLPRAERARIHERAAEVIGAQAGERRLELAELVAYHRVQAAQLDSRPERREAAFQALREAAAIVGARGASARAQELYEEAAEHAPTARDRLSSLRAAAQVAVRQFRGDQGLRLLRKEAHVAEEAGELGSAAAAIARAVEVATRYGGVTGETDEDELVLLWEHAREIADPEDLETKTRLLLDEAWIAWRYSREDEMREPSRLGLELARDLDDLPLLSSALDAAIAVDWLDLRYSEAVERSKERLALLDAAPNRTPAIEMERSDALHMLIESLLQISDYRGAAEHATRAREADLSRGVVYSGWSRGIIPSYFLGDWDTVIEMATRVREAWSGANRPPVAVLASSLATAGAVHSYRGEETTARDWFNLANEIAPRRAAYHSLGVDLMRAEAALHHGRLDEALDAVSEPLSGWTWWGPNYAAMRAELLTLADDPQAGAMREEARPWIASSPFGQAMLMRTEAAMSADEEGMREALALFESIGCRYQAARTAWLLGGADRDRAASIFDELRISPPAELSA